jgi:poly [ADP-ribose] polymerase
MNNYAYLMFVDADVNHNKFYEMVADKNILTCNYGRVGGHQAVATYPASAWSRKYEEKIRKGYVDKTELKSKPVLEAPKDNTTMQQYAPIPEPDIKQLVADLMAYADHTIQSNYKITSAEVTQMMIDEAQDKICKLRSQAANNADVYDFNAMLLDLFMIIPRRMDEVRNYVAGCVQDYGSIIQREQDLLDVMQSRVQIARIPLPLSVQKKAGKIKKSDSTTILDAMHLQMEPVTDGDMVHIRKLLGNQAYKFSRAWKVVNLDTQKRFDDYLTAHGKPKVRLFWHGSRNENWWSILTRGLSLHPGNVSITGKMFGNGLYFAPSCDKSLGYTSLNGSRWAHGGSNISYMAVFATAYGSPAFIDGRGGYSHLNAKAFEKEYPGKNCLYAKAGSYLHKDEVIFFREEQMTVKYLVEFKD